MYHTMGICLSIIYPCTEGKYPEAGKEPTDIVQEAEIRRTAPETIFEPTPDV